MYQRVSEMHNRKLGKQKRTLGESSIERLLGLSCMILATEGDPSYSKRATRFVELR
jgi:hypothetical protein